MVVKNFLCYTFVMRSLILAVVVAGLVAIAPKETTKETVKEVPRTITTNDAGQKKQTAADQPPPAAEHNATGAVGQKIPNKSASDENDKRSQRIVLWSAIAQGASAVVIAFLTFFLLLYSHRGWTVAKTAADAATLGADTAKRALEVVERPDVLVKHVGFDHDTLLDIDQYPGWVIGPEAVLEVTVKNYGRTTARHLMILGFLAVDPMPPLAMPLRVVEEPELLGSGETLKFRFLSIGNAFPQQILEQITMGKVKLWVQVNIEYEGFEQHNITGHAFYDESNSEFSITHSNAERPLN